MPMLNDPNDKGYQTVEVKSLSMDVMAKLNDLQELFNLSPDLIMIVARHYHWSESKMQNWFEDEERLKFQLGVAFDERLKTQKPEINASLPENHEGYCMICYSELDDTNSFALDCKHSFCTYCWTDYLKDKVATDYTGIDSLCMQ